MPTRSLMVAMCLLALCVVGTSSTLAFVPPPDGNALEVRLPADQVRYMRTPGEFSSIPAARQYTAYLADELGDGWYVASWNQFTETAQAVEGPGLLLDATGFAAATPVQMEGLSRDFIAAHPGLFGTDGDNLELLKINHGGHHWGVLFQQIERGVPVMHSSVLLAYHDNGRLFAFGSQVYRDLDLSPRPTIELPVARALARSAVPFDPSTDEVPGPEMLLIVPLHRGIGEIEFHLTHRTDVPTSEPVGLWRTYVDAHTGEIVYRNNEIDFLYEGNVQGDVDVHSYCDNEVPDLPASRMYVAISGVGTAITDYDGDFSIGTNTGPHPFNALLSGPDFDVNCIGCGGDALITGTIYPDTPLDLYWDSATFRADERDAWHYTNKTKEWIWTLDPTWSLFRYTVEVNYPDNCNAIHSYSAQRLRFYQEGGGCANMATIGGVVAHEFGHGVHRSLLSGQNGYEGLGEGNADISASFLVDDPEMAIGFYNCAGGIRNCDNTLIYPDDLTGQIHHDGQIICGFNWDLRLILEAKMGAEAGELYTGHLWHFARKLWGSPSMNQQSQVDFYRYADDDDGNLANGTPNWDEIMEAAVGHGYYFPVNPNRAEIDHTPLVDNVNPAGPYVVEADVRVFIEGTPTDPDDVEIVYSVNGGGFSSVPMANTGGDTYAGDIPTQPAGTAIAYYIRVAHDSGLEEFHPENAPTGYHLFGVGAYDVVANHEMEADDGYTVGAPGDDATVGLWERGDPILISLGLILQPEDDHTPAPGTDCWITGNSNVPAPFGPRLDGRTTLNSPVMDMTGANLVKGSVWTFTYLSVPGSDDYLDINLSTDGGSTWTNLEHIDQPSSPDWVESTFRLSPLEYNFTSQMQFRFVVEDEGANAIVEALVDDFLVEGLFGGSTAAGGAAEAAPLTLRLGHATPNPFNPSTRIHYSLPARDAVRLTVYDVQGRLIRDLVQGMQEPGAHTADWDGMDTRGTAAASGVYYYKLVVGDWSETRPMVLLK